MISYFISIQSLLFMLCQLLYIALVCTYAVHMGHWPSGLSKIN